MDALTQIDPRLAAIEAAVNSLNSDHSKQAYRRHLMDFLEWYTKQGQPPLTKSVIGAYRSHLSQHRGTATVNQALAAIKCMIREAADNGLVDPVHANGIANVKGISSETLPAGRSIKPGELSAMIRVCKDDGPLGARDAAIIALLYSCGLRRSELVNLNLADYEAGELKIRKAKRNKDRLVYMVDGAVRALDDWLSIRGDEGEALFLQIRKGGHIRCNRLTTQAVYHILQQRGKQAGVSDISPHDFRRTFVGDLLDAGADIAIVQKLAGHADVSTTARYDRRPEDAKRKAAQLLHVPY